MLAPNKLLIKLRGIRKNTYLWIIMRCFRHIKKVFLSVLCLTCDGFMWVMDSCPPREYSIMHE